jgi:hypothetical protein
MLVWIRDNYQHLYQKGAKMSVDIVPFVRPTTNQILDRFITSPRVGKPEQRYIVYYRYSAARSEHECHD